MVDIAALALALTLAADPPWDGEPFSAEPTALLAASAQFEAPVGSEIKLLLEETRVALEADGRATWTFRQIFAPRTSAAAKSWASISIPYSPWFEARPEIRARIISPDGQVHWLDPATLTEGVLDGSGDAVFSDRRAVQGPLPAMSPNAVVEQQIVLRETAPFFEAGTSGKLMAMRKETVHRVRFLIEVPAALPVRVQARGLPAPAEERRADRRVFTLSLDDLPPPQDWEPWSPPELLVPRHVAFSTARSWQAVARAYAALVDRKLEGADLAALARGITSPGDRPAEAGQKVLDWVATKVRYTGLHLGDAGIIPASPAETLKRGYGDCKDLSVLVAGLLRASGHRASLALLRTEPDEVDPALPGLGLFDHAVVRVEAKPALWLDPAVGASAGELGGFSQGRLALIADASSTGLVRSPELAAADNRSTRALRIELAENGPARVSEESRAWGDLATGLRQILESSPAARLEQWARDRLKAEEGARVEHRFELGSASTGLRILREADASRLGSTADNTAEAVVAPSPVFRHLPGPFRVDPPAAGEDDAPPAPRRLPMRLLQPHLSELTYRVIPPPGFQVASLPSMEGFAVGSARFEASFESEPTGAVAATYRFEVGRELKPAEADRLWREVAERTRSDGPRVVFEQTSRALLRAGKAREALEELQRMVELHPKEARHRNDRALTLLALGLGEAARAEARRAVALEPEDEWAHRVLGFILQHDLLGRRFAPGADSAGALESLRRARSRAPSSPAARGLLAQMLLHDHAQSGGGPGPRLDEALAELRAIRGELRHHGFDEDFLEALMAAGRAEEALQFAREMQPGERRDAVLLAAALAQSPETFAKELERLQDKERPKASAQAMLGLLFWRQYPALAGLAQLARRGGAGPPELTALETVARAQRHEALRFDEKDPAQLPARILQAFGAAAPASALKRLSLEGLETSAALEKDLAGIPSGLLSAGLGDSWTGIGRASLIDIALAAITTRVEGERSPWKLVVSTPDQPDFLTVIAIEDGGSVRFAAFEPGPGEMGRLALRLAKAGDLKGARRLLDWASERAPKAEPGEPSPSGLIAALWPPGGKGDGPSVLRAATALAALTQGKEDLRPALESLRLGAAGAEQRALTFAALVATGADEDAGRALKLSDGLLAAGGHLTDDLWLQRMWVLRRLGRADEARQEAERRLQGQPADRTALRFLLQLARDEGDAALRQKLEGALLAPSVAEAQDLRDAAWAGLFEEPVAPETLARAERAAKLGPPNAWVLYTLAAAQAFSGRPPREAMRTLGRAVELRGGELLADDWLVVALAAEAYGLFETAAAAYGRVRPESDGHRFSPWELARRRLRALALPEDCNADTGAECEQAWRARFYAAIELRDNRDAIRSLARLARRWPGTLPSIPAQWVWHLIGESKRPLAGDERLPLLEALFEARWMPDGLPPAHIWRDLSAMYADRGDLRRAAEVAGQIENPGDLIAMRVDRRFDPIARVNPELFDIAKVDAAHLALLRAAVRKMPRSLNALVELSRGFLQRHRYREALALTEDALAKLDAAGPPRYDDADRQRPWVMNTRASALGELGRWDEAVAELKRSAALAEGGRPNVSQVLNLAALYCLLDRPSDALEALARVGAVSPFGRMVLEKIRLQAAAQMGDGAARESALGYLREHRDDGIEVYQSALITAGELEEAARLLVSRLADPKLRSAALVEVQQYAPHGSETSRVREWRERRNAVLARPEVQAAIAEVGRIERFELDAF